MNLPSPSSPPHYPARRQFSGFLRASLFWLSLATAAGSAPIPLEDATGTGITRLKDDRPAIQFERGAPTGAEARWALPAALPPGWYSARVDFGPDSGTRKMIALEWLDPSGKTLLSVDLYHAPGARERDSKVVFGVHLSSPAGVVRLRKNQNRNMPSTPILGLSLAPGRPAPDEVFMEAASAPLAAGSVRFPPDFGGGLVRAVAQTPVRLFWESSGGRSFHTPEAGDTAVFLDAPLAKLSANGAADQMLVLERRFDKPSPVPAEILKQPVLPLAGGESETLLLEVRGKNLQPEQAEIADFPGGARMAAVQSWDDGIPQDERLARLLHETGWRATFFFNRHSPALGKWKTLEDLGMEVGSHSWSHPPYWLQSPKRCLEESLGLRIFLEQTTGHPVLSFGYPFNYNPAYDADGDYVLRAQAETGYLACRSTRTGSLTLDVFGNPLAMPTNGHFLMPRDQIEAAWKQAAETKRGIFHIWGHSYELPKESDWQAFGELLGQYGNRPEAWYASLGDLMVWKWMRETARLAPSGGATHATIRITRPKPHRWWAARVPAAIRLPGHITHASTGGKPLGVINGEIQIPWTD